MKRTTNAIAAVITLAAWGLGMFTEHTAIAWTVMITTFAVMCLTGQTAGYPFDWAVKAWRRKP